MGKESLGEFEHLVMLAILRLGDGAYGVPIMEELEARSGRSVTHAAGYATLKRLEEKGFISSTRTLPSANRRGRPRRYFKVEEEGLRRIRESRAALMNMWDGLPVLEEQQ